MLELFGQFLRFTGVGFVSAIGHYGLLIALVQGVGSDPVVASAAGATLGAAINYSLNYRLTFRSGKRHREAVAKFLVVASIGLALNALLMWLGVDVLGLHYLLAQVLTTGLVLVWSFAGNRCWTFHEKSATAPERWPG